jgi:hypothetical protein
MVTFHIVTVTFQIISANEKNTIDSSNSSYFKITLWQDKCV